MVDDILAETYGIMAYQEQVMMVLNRLGKLPLGRAYALIKAISKKKEKDIAKEKPNFLAGAKENGLSEKEVEELFEQILRFAGYGFNKSHSHPLRDHRVPDGLLQSALPRRVPGGRPHV